MRRTQQQTHPVWSTQEQSQQRAATALVMVVSVARAWAVHQRLHPLEAAVQARDHDRPMHSGPPQRAQPAQEYMKCRDLLEVAQHYMKCHDLY